MLGLVVDGIEGLPADVRPERSLMMSAIGRVCGIERSNGVAKDVLGSLLAEYRSAGVEPVLMKGLGVGDRYPCPDHRACGDIDLFLPVRPMRSRREPLPKGCRRPLIPFMPSMPCFPIRVSRWRTTAGFAISVMPVSRPCWTILFPWSCPATFLPFVYGAISTVLRSASCH